MNYIALFSAAILFFAICASEAEARKFRLFSISGLDGGETIDPVYNLPNTATFLREGKTFDLGYLNSGDGGGYVLYHGDRYARLSEADIARLKVTLGFDPTTKHRTEQAGRDKQNSGWSLAILVAVLALGSFVFIHKGLQILRWLGRTLTTPAAVKAGSGDVVSDPLAVRKKQLVKRERSETQSDHAARSPAPAAVQVSPRTAGPARSFGRRSG
ncbi:hypothetical protein O3S81_02040 [Agrobacterium sp. SOY23]|uniref:hypothetical protein n=1 Tax=Agrobacterium sp. SOY23 TaxID=3014555 RepID=UPI0022AFA005|nr:hypothetical protein [Agrobacterium sp. SOY23]MCZ4428473.1 hypothetical protein [Agrobacterium sp. SOY23]